MNAVKPSWEMKHALRLAKKAKGWTLPNPLVGAVVLNTAGKRIGEGYHKKYGYAHAEVEALAHCKESPAGGTLFVTLEPCCHQGKTPPCTEAIIAAKIAKVIVAVQDPSEKVQGKGIAALKAAGIEVELGLLEEEARTLNKFFFTYHEKKRPYITLKAALSLDGKIAEAKNKKTMLTGKPAQRYVHALRHEHEAILVGAGTVLTDDPHLGVREIEGRDPLRIILAGRRPLPQSAQVFRDENVMVIKEKTVSKILKRLYETGITSVLVEGGQQVFETFLKSEQVDELQLLFAPILLGKKGVPFAELQKSLELNVIQQKSLGKDFLLHAVTKF